jgi:hypothetical protein
VFRLERERVVKGQQTQEVVYGITSLTRAAAAAADLLGYCRAHWGIENGCTTCGMRPSGRTAAGCGGGTRHGC